MFNSFERADYAVIATIMTSARDVKLIVRKSAGIGAARQFEGRRVGTAKGSSAHYFLDTFLLFNDLDPRRVNVVAMAPDRLAAALQNRELDAVAVWEPFAWMSLQAAGADAMVFESPRLYTETFNLIADRKSIAAREHELVGVLRALQRAVRFIHAQPQPAQQILKARLELDQAFIDATWSDFDFRIGLEQSLVSTLEAEAR